MEVTDHNYKTLLLQFIGSLTLCDHMGDVSNDVSTVLDRVGLGELEWGDWSDLGEALGKMGVTTLHGTTLYDPEDQNEKTDISF